LRRSLTPEQERELERHRLRTANTAPRLAAQAAAARAVLAAQLNGKGKHP
jgi:hypothetical protein